MANDELPEWADEWDGRKHCRFHKAARLVVVSGWGGRHEGICSESGWSSERCAAESAPEPPTSIVRQMQRDGTWDVGSE